MLPTSQAMAVAGMDRLKFNDAVFKGHYPCAPETAEGSYRLFDEIDVVALTIFARCMDHGFAARHSGAYACIAEKLMRQGQEIASYYRVRTVDGEKGDLFTEVGQDFSTARYATVFEINVANIRAHVRQAMMAIARAQGTGA